MIGKQRAARVIARHGTNDPEDVVAREGLSVATLDFGKARFREFSYFRTIFIPVDFTLHERRSLLAHALGHHYLHGSNQAWLRWHDRIWNWKLERQAEEFAAWLLIPEGETPSLYGLTVAEIAEAYNVDVKLAEVRVGL